MPLKLSIRLGTVAVLDIDGDATIDENLVKLAQVVVQSLAPGSEANAQTQIDEAAAKLKAQQDALEAAQRAADQPAASSKVAQIGDGFQAR